MFQRFILVAAFAVFLFPHVAAAQANSAYDRVMAKNEIVCGLIPWAPYKVLDPNTKEWSGHAVEIYRKAFATLDIKVKFYEVTLGTQIEDLNSGRVDAICHDGPWTMSAGKFVEYSDPLYATPVFPYVRKNDDRFKTRADFNNKTVNFTGIDGDLSTDLVKRLFPNATVATMPAITDVAQLFLNVAGKKADVAIVDPSAFSVFDKNNPGQLKPVFKDKPLGIYKILISVKKGDVKMLGLVNQAVDNALTFGLVDEILDKEDPKRQKFMRVRSRYEQ